MDPLQPFWPRQKERLREVAELFVLPGVGALLPWPLTLRLMRFLSRWRGWYIAEVSAATEMAHRFGVAPDAEAFSRRLRWRLMIDAVDGYLVVLRGQRYQKRWLRTHGDALPERGPVMFIGTHHGCGYWFLPYLRDCGLPMNVIAPRLDPLLAKLAFHERVYARMRHRLIAFAAGRPLVYRGNASAGLSELLAAGEIGFGLADMPTNRPDAVPVQIAGHPTHLAQNLFELAEKLAVPVYLFSSDTDLGTGERHLYFEHLRAGTPEERTRRFGELLDELVRRDPSGWRFWPIAQSFFRDGSVPAEINAA